MKRFFENAGGWKKRLWIWLVAGIILVGVSIVQAEPKKFDWDKPFANPLNLIHITETGTMYGPVKKDVYILHAGTPKDGVLLTADGSGGWFINKASKTGGPFNTPREVCNAVKGIDPKKLSIGFNCATITVEKETPEAPDRPDKQSDQKDQETPTEEAGVQPRPLASPELEQEPGEPPIDECDDPESELRKLGNLRKAILSTERDYHVARTKMALQRIVIRKIQIEINRYDHVIRKHEATARNIMYANLPWVNQWNTLRAQQKELRDAISEVYNRQDQEIIDLMRDYDDRLGQVQSLLAESKCESVKDALLKLKSEMREKRDLSVVELYLVSGQTEKCRDLAQTYLDSGEYKDKVLHMLGLSYLETGEAANALYAFRDALKANPNSSLLKEELRKIEVAYLRAIDRKVQGEAAMVRAKAWERFKEFGEKGWWGAIKTFLDAGIVESTRAIYGDFDKLEVLQSVQLHDAAVQHTGLLLLMRLRDKGFTFDEIKSLNNEKFIATVNDLFQLKEENKIEPLQAMRMRFAITQAFRNEDVDRLMKQTPQEFAVDSGKSYFTTQDFEKTWIETAYDVVDVKNVAMFLGPNAVVSAGGKTAWFTQGKFIKGLKTADLANATTVRDLFWTLRPVAKALDAFKESDWGRRYAEYLLKFEAESSLTQKIVAEALVQDGVIQAGQYFGGAPGQAVAEVLTILMGVGDVDQAAKVLRRAGVQGDDIGQVLKKITMQLDNAARLRVPDKHRHLMTQALKEINETGVLSKNMQQVLRKNSDEFLRELDQIVKRVGNAELSSIEALTLKQAKMVQQALEDLSHGKGATARIMSQSIDEMDGAIRKTEQILQEKAQRCKSLTAKIGEVGDEVADSKIKRATDGMGDAPGLQSAPEAAIRPGVGTSSDKAKHVMKRLSHDGVDADVPDHIRKIFRSGDEALQGGNFSKAQELYAEGAVMIQSLKKNAGADQLEELTRASEEALEKYKLARNVQIEMERIRPSGSAIKDVTMKPIGEAQKQKVSKAISDALSEVEKEAQQEVMWKAKKIAQETGEDFNTVFKRITDKEYDKIYDGVLDKRMQPLTTSTGKPSRYGPRTIEVDGEVFVYKPASREFKNLSDIRGEVSAYNLARELNMNTPASAQILVDEGVGQKQGLLMRYVHDAQDLTVADPEKLMAVKQHVADDRVMSLFLGDYDRHSGNLLLTGKGDFFSVDHNIANLVEDINAHSEFVHIDYDKATDAELAAMITKRMEEKYEFFMRMRKGRPRIEVIDSQIKFKDMEPMVNRIKKLSEKQIESVLDGVYQKGSTEWRNAKRTLMIRQECLGRVLSGYHACLKRSSSIAWHTPTGVRKLSLLLPMAA